MACILDGDSLTLTGDVGDLWFSDCFTHGDVVLALAQVDENSTLTVYLNSGGGLTDEGAAIHALLSRRLGTTDIVVDGVAASAASLIAMAGDTVTMSAGAIMMIHDPSGMTFGTSEDHAKSAEMLEAIATAYARVYAAKSGKTADECRAIMKAERWYSPDEAVAEGFADKTSDTEAKPVAAWDYRTYAHAPQRLKAMASKKDWRRPDAGDRTSASASSRQPKETSMTEKTKAGENAADMETAKAEAGKSAVTAYKARRAAVMAMDEAKGREELAEELIETDLPEDRIKAMLTKAHKAEAREEDTPEAHDRRQTNGEGLNGGAPKDKPSAKGDKTLFKNATAKVNKRR